MSNSTQRIIDMLSRKNLTWAAVANELGLQANALSEWRKGKAKPSIDALCKLADYFEVSLDYLAGRTSPNVSYENRGTINGGMGEIHGGVHVNSPVSTQADRSSVSNGDHARSGDVTVDLNSPVSSDINRDGRVLDIIGVCMKLSDVYLDKLIEEAKKLLRKDQGIPTCFVITPIGDPNGDDGNEEKLKNENMVKVIDQIITPACTKFDIKPVTSNLKDGRYVMEDIYAALKNDDIVIANLSVICKKYNANVYYEVEYHEALGRQTILIMENPHKVPFDIFGSRVITFTLSDDNSVTVAVSRITDKIIELMRERDERRASVAQSNQDVVSILRSYGGADGLKKIMEEQSKVERILQSYGGTDGLKKIMEEQSKVAQILESFGGADGFAKLMASRVNS